MVTIEDRIFNWIEIFAANYPCNFVCSGSNVPGEGEEKIFSYINGIKDQSDTFVIFSGDSDLMLYSKSLQLKLTFSAFM
jgi:5'-3' exonuclease